MNKNCRNKNRKFMNENNFLNFIFNVKKPIKNFKGPCISTYKNL